MFKKILNIISELGILASSKDLGSQEAAMAQAASRLWEVIEPKIPEELRLSAIRVCELLPKIEVWNYESLSELDKALQRLFNAVSVNIPEPYTIRVSNIVLGISLLNARAITMARIQGMFKNHGKNGNTWTCRKCSHNNDAVHYRCVACDELSSPDWVYTELGILCDDIRCLVHGGTPS